MIAIGYSFGNQAQRDTILLPSIASSLPDEKILLLEEGSPGKNTSIFPIYNRILERARREKNIEFLALLHTDVELRDPFFANKIRDVLKTSPTVAVIGCVGTNIDGDLKRWERRNFGWVPSPHFPHFGEDRSGLPPLDKKGRAEAASIDGLLIILSPWAIATLRFDEESFHGFHGYDADICMQARQKGMRVLVQEFDLVHHTRGGYTGGGYEEFEKANHIFMRKWKLPTPTNQLSRPTMRKHTVVVVVIYNRFSNLERWIACWKQCATEDAELVIVHNYYGDESAKEKYGQYCAQRGIQYIPRLGEGYDIGAFQDICRNRLSEFPDYDYLLWCTDDCIPMQKDFIAPFLAKLTLPRVGVACMKLFSGSGYPDHVRTTGFCLRKEIAQALTFPADPIQTKDHCYDFELRAGEKTFYKQILNKGLLAVAVAPDAESPLWDTDFGDRLPRQMEHNQMFGSSKEHLDTIQKLQERNPAFEQLQKEVRLAGTDYLPFFANGYAFEGGLYLQQNPDEFAALCALLEERKPHATYVEIGSASGGACLFLHRKLGFKQVLSLDDGKHPRASVQPLHFGEIAGLTQYVGDSHAEAATRFLATHVGPEGIDVAFIDGDHSYRGVMCDILLVKPFCKPGTLIVFHDIVAVADVKQAWLDGASLKLFKPIAEYVGASVPLGIGVAEVC